MLYLQDAHILKTTWAVAFASLCPRLVAVYLYVWDYEASFLPAVNLTSQRGAGDGDIDKYTLNVRFVKSPHMIVSSSIGLLLHLYDRRMKFQPGY